MKHEIITASEIRRRWEEWPETPQAKAAAKEVEEKIIKPFFAPIFEHIFKVLEKHKNGATKGK